MTTSVTPVYSPPARTLLPGLAAVGRLVEAALAAGGPERSLRGDVDDVRVARIDDDLGDVLGLLEAHVRPALAAVEAAVDAVAVADVAAADVLAGADPDDVRGRSDRSSRSRSSTSPGRRRSASRSCRRWSVFQTPPEPDRHVPGALVVGIDGDVGDAARHQRRSDAAQLEALEGGGDSREPSSSLAGRLSAFFAGAARGRQRASRIAVRIGRIAFSCVEVIGERGAYDELPAQPVSETPASPPRPAILAALREPDAQAPSPLSERPRNGTVNRRRSSGGGGSVPCSISANI